MTETEHTADDIPVTGRGELIASGPPAESAARGGRREVTVRAPDPAALTALVTATATGSLERAPDGSYTVTGLDAPRPAELAFEHRVMLHELTPRTTSLEGASPELTAGHTGRLSGERR
ncbi:hypothetical protein [Streptomyces sp. NPDC001985]|uniref:hypothetical protein n=1 Tax=Streptomyces sp. NPDC001985 TaxID=3154406 RepID=UPI00332587B6